MKGGRLVSSFLDIGDRIKKKRLALNLSQQELAEKVGYTSRSSINKIELGLVNLPQSKVQLLAQVLNTSVSYILWGKESDTTATVSEDDYEKYGLRRVVKKKFPVLGEIACGEPIFAEQDFESFIEADSDINADFCLIAKGDSMIGARIYDGDVVFIRKQPIVNNGQIAAVIVDGDATLKRWYYYPEKKQLVLNPENSVYAPLVYVGKELNTIRCLGLAVCCMSRVK